MNFWYKEYPIGLKSDIFKSNSVPFNSSFHSFSSVKSFTTNEGCWGNWISFPKKVFKIQCFLTLHHRHNVFEKWNFYLREFGIANKFFNFLSLRYDNDMALSDDFKEIYYDELLKVREASFLLVLQSVISFLSSDYYLPAYFSFVDGDDKKIMHWSGNDNTNR